MSTPEQTKFRTILLCVDGSEHSLAAVKLLRDLQITEKPDHECHIQILNVLNPRESSNYTAYMFPINQAKNLLEEKGYQCETQLTLGYPAEIITQYADNHQPDLIVMGAKGLRSTLGILLGGVAQQVIEYSCYPVLIVRAPYQGLKRVMLVIDGSPSSQLATDFFGKFCFPEEIEIYVSHVLPPAPIYDPRTIIQTWAFPSEVIQEMPNLPTAEELQQLEAEEKRHGQEILDNAIQKLNLLNIISIPVLLQGDAATEIIKFTQQNQIDLIFAGSRGLSQMRGWLLGSVSRKLVHYAGCSVLIVKSKP